MVRPSPGGHLCQLPGALAPAGLDSNGGTVTSNKGGIGERHRHKGAIKRTKPAW